jgi:hypothetical protein
VAGTSTLEQANRYLEDEFLPWWNQHLVVAPANPTDAHRPLGTEHDLASALSLVETRVVANDYTIRYEGKLYQIARVDVRTGLRGATVRVESRLDGSFSPTLCGHQGMSAAAPSGAEANGAYCSAKATPGRRLESKFRFEESAKDLAGSPSLGHSQRPVLSGFSGFLPYRRWVAIKPGEALRNHPGGSLPYTGVPVCVFKASRNLSIRCGLQNFQSWAGTAPVDRGLSSENATGGPRPAHRLDEFRPAIPRSGCSPAEPVSASPARTD